MVSERNESESSVADGSTVESNQDSGLTIMDLLAAIRKHWAIAVSAFAVVLILVGAYTILATPQYTASSELYATYDNASADSESITDINTAGSYISTQIKSYPTLATTQAVLDPVISDLNLNMNVAELGKLITVSNPTNTMLIDISVETDSPAQSQQIANAVAESLSKTVKSSLYSSKNSPVKLAVVQKATLPTSPSSPNIKLNLLIGVLLGSIVGILAALLRDMTDTRLNSIQDLRRITGAPLLGSIPTSDAVSKAKPVVSDDPNSMVAEEYRRIRGNLSFIAPVEGTHSRLLIVTSTLPSEGKTSTSTNLAAAFAENGSRVLLIDADLRHPSISNKLEIDGSIGLSHVLSNQANVADAVQRYWKNDLHVMPAGPKPPNASLLLNSTLMEAMIQQALKQYDYVIVDTTPLDIAADAGMFGRISKGIVLVSGRGVCDKKELAESVAQLKNVNVPIIGTIFNFAEQHKSRKGNYYYYDSEGKKQERHAHAA
ncbi:MAG: polysaccharide biosynthesis tyrosine autokinase [Bifidobacterium aquikefiri]|uniref:non-specific protein-tyrosine kinase n=1 Tax=Bifidobacterium aquikefiri TaxID=1653207 RepID=A0A261G2E3_9BIFI|nr:protein-tyrosine kinase [Bifidobacterium aquikefiri]